MEQAILTPLQMREVFHLEFLRWFLRKVKAEHYALKGGVNMRFFFRSVRYSEDMDLDARGISVAALQEKVMTVLGSASFAESLRSFGIRTVAAPDLSVAKQTETTQRFKVHLGTASGEELFTKIEFSRRGSTGTVNVESVSDAVLRPYRLAPLLVAHYDARTAIAQKISALGSRAVLQARDIFDLFVLRSQVADASGVTVAAAALNKARERVFEAEFELFRDTVVAYLSAEDQDSYAQASAWEEVKLSVAEFLERISAHG